MKDTRLLLAPDGVRSPAEKSPVVQRRDRGVGDNAVAAGGGVAALRHVYGVRRVVECPVKGCLQRVGLDGAGDFGVLVAAHGVTSDLARRAHWGVWEGRRERSGG